ncbi:MAG TPA: RseA family anti-sigma factor [Rhodanobacteraceae bacterium]|nr:RseA family anti-sigma factor [Rhodanobacteraceae bacterium]
MTDQINDQISAFIDNELSADESALLVRRFERDGEARTRAMRYTLIGASLRGELLEPHPSVLRQRIAAALSGTTVPSLPKARERLTDRWARPLLGLGIAATVAVVAIGTLRSLNEVSLAPSGLPVGGAVPLQVRDVNAPIYVVPQNTELSGTGAPIRLTNYLIHHGEFASGLTRTSVNSNVLGGAIEPAVAETVLSKPVKEEGLE